MLSAVSVLVADHCPAWWPQPNHPKVPTTCSACRKAGPASCVDGTSRQGFPGSGTRSTCQEAKLDLLAPSTATVPRPTTAFFPHVHPSNALGHMGRCPRPAIQPLTPPLDYDLSLAPPSRWKSPPPSDPAGLNCLSPVPLLVGPNQESMEGGPLTIAAPGSFQSGSVRGGIIFSCSLWGLLGCKSQSLLGYGFMCCRQRHRGVPVPAW